MGHGAIGIDCRTARGDNASLRFKGAQNLVFNFDETFRTKSIDDLLQGLIALVLDEQVGIDEVVVHDLREHDTERRFSCARHSDKGDAACLIHCDSFSS